ncbi:MAG: TonB-dependent receptor [Caulobacteraceae bacterium]|nr:TonB-dependent receptor [Caulobacteraceae bacterium]
MQFSDVDFAAVGDEAFITPTNTQDSGVFVVERYDLGSWGLEGGARYERRELDSQTFGTREFDNVSASFGMFVRPAPNWFVGATLASVERAPTAFELFSDGPHLATSNYEIGDPDLQQEKATSFEASLRYNRGPFRFEMNLYGMDFSNYIALVERGDVWWVDEDTDTSGFAADEGSAPGGADEILPVFAFVQQDATFVGGELSAAMQVGEINGFAITTDGSLDLGARGLRRRRASAADSATVTDAGR